MSSYMFIPESERPYEWAYSEMMKAYEGKPKRINLQLAEATILPGCHVSLFAKKDASAIYRVHWYETNSVSYSIVENYDRLKKVYPEIVTLLLNNGVAAYKKALESAGGNAMSYEPLRPIKKED